MKELHNRLAVPPLYGQVPGLRSGPHAFGSYAPTPRARAKIRKSGGLRVTSGTGGAYGDGRTAVIEYGVAPVVPAVYSGPTDEQTSAALQTGAGAAASAASLVGAAAAAGVVGGPAGWIVAGGLLGAALVLKLTDILRKKGAQAARAEVAALGYGDDFVREYVRLATAKKKKIDNRVQQLQKIVSREEKQIRARTSKGKAAKKADTKRLGKAVDQLNAAKMVLLGRTMAPEEPVIVGQPLTTQGNVESRGPVGDMLDGIKTNPTPYIAGAGVILLASSAGWIWSRRR